MSVPELGQRRTAIARDRECGAETGCLGWTDLLNELAKGRWWWLSVGRSEEEEMWSLYFKAHSAIFGLGLHSAFRLARPKAISWADQVKNSVSSKRKGLSVAHKCKGSLLPILVNIYPLKDSPSA